MGYKKKSDVEILTEIERKLTKRIRKNDESQNYALAKLVDSLLRVKKLKNYYEISAANPDDIPQINCISDLDIDKI